MATRTPLVQNSGDIQQLQSGDPLSPVSVSVLRILDASYTMPDNTSLVFVNSLTLSNNVSLTVPSTSGLLILGTTGGRAFSLSSALNTSIDVNSTTYQTILATSSQTLSVNDTLIIEFWATILNNSGGNRTYSMQVNIGNVAVFDTSFSTSIGSSATARGPVKFKCITSISSTVLWYAFLELIGTVATSSIAAGSNSGLSTQGAWNTGSNNFTGSQTISVKVKTDSAAGTQTLTLQSYEIRRMAQQLT